MDKKRIFYYDLLKSLAIFLVCFYHFGMLDNDINKEPGMQQFYNYFIYCLSAVGVPVFLMINGALLLNRDYSLKKHLNKTLTILLLTIIWGVLTLIVTGLAYHDHYSAKEFAEALIYMKQGRNNHLWYLKAILYIYLLFPMVKALFEKKSHELNMFVLILLFFFTFGQNLVNNSVDLISFISGMDLNAVKQAGSIAFSWLNPFGLYLSFSLLFFFIGGLLPEWLKSKYNNVTVNIFIFFVSWILLFISGIIKTKQSGMVYDTVWNGYNTLAVLAMTVSLFALCSKYEPAGGKISQVVQLIGANSLGIYLIHVLVGSWLSGLYLSCDFNGSLLSGFLFALVILFLSLGITLVVKKIPFIKKLVTL